MAEELTAQQRQAVMDRGGELLVSAAAGSGKTKVLVDRLMSYLMDSVDPANLDDFLIITYTKAAAAELRGKIAAKLSQHIALNPENRHLQQQMQRLYLAKISTVHAFCTDMLREFAYKLDIAADFRVLDEGEGLELQERAMQQVLNEAYACAGEDPNFTALVDTQGLGRDDRHIPEIVYKVYNSAKCHLNPEQWLEWCLSVSDVCDKTDASETVWGKYLIDNLHRCLDLHISALNCCIQKASASEGMEKPTMLLMDTVSQLQILRSCDSWDAIYRHRDIDYGRLSFSKNCTDLMLIEQIKQVRDACKKELAKKLRDFADDSAQVLADMQQSVSAAKGLVSLVRKFSRTYDQFKENRRVLDFGDLEHKTLDLLIGKNRNNITREAAEIGGRFREVMVDEYQDSNVVQDAIFSALTKEKHNCFMVGDVKQSIYQFRLADPGIFLEKYNTFVPAESAKIGQGRKVLLSSNFRSAGSVIDAVNHVFSCCMSPAVGGLEYGDDESLREGIAHCAIDEQEIELHGICVQEDTYAEEAAFVANRIRQLLNGNHVIRDGDALRPIQPGDIAILLRSPGSIGGEYRLALELAGIRCTIGSSSDLLHTEEIETLRALLHVINNPLQDIPLLSVLTSRIFLFTADDLASVRSECRNGSIYTALQNSQMPKAKDFLEILETLRAEARVRNLPELLNKILIVTRMDTIFSTLPGGAEKVENIQDFCQIAAGFESCGIGGLCRFLERLNAIDERGLACADRGSDGNAVTIMSIHKSKGLEFPIVFLCGLSRDFNGESARAKVLCDKELGLGLSCVDTANRVRYPSIAKRAIAAKIVSEGISEEMRVLYVAMTRARDRLIMTYASRSLEAELTSIANRMIMSDPLLITANADCPGKWLLYAALKRKEAAQFFAITGCLDDTIAFGKPWKIQVISNVQRVICQGDVPETREISPNEDVVAYIKNNISFQYPHILATTAPSKQTATQLKGRSKDVEASQNADNQKLPMKKWRKPSFVEDQTNGKDYGNAFHAVMEHIRFESCGTVTEVDQEIARLVNEEYISKQQAEMVDSKIIAAFFATEIGVKLRSGKNVLREFKFSILDDGERYCPGMENEKVLLQGVVDCALIEEDGITIVDFKTDNVTEDTFTDRAENYRMQIEIYADALSRIYRRPIKSAMLYFFRLGRFYDI